NVVMHDPDLARRTRLELWAEHLELPVSTIDGNPIDVIDEFWKPMSQAQHDLRRAGKPLTHRLVCLPRLSKRTSRLFGPISGLLVDG
ncbi:MAG TPA: hypothetical protein VG265_08705, partial [Gaiellaceae bacterium]|nr:hypothetical protein [Gaiellaceae bacterium]